MICITENENKLAHDCYNYFCLNEFVIHKFIETSSLEAVVAVVKMPHKAYFLEE